mmetsp:Transcript_23500/g.50966  ORF Transcript_23500/g.50966 Transcript_23500/m.50966 type:complete len:382 (-) Transcript_23500:6-1151(-)
MSAHDQESMTGSSGGGGDDGISVCSSTDSSVHSQQHAPAKPHRRDESTTASHHNTVVAQRVSAAGPMAAPMAPCGFDEDEDDPESEAESVLSSDSEGNPQKRLRFPKSQQRLASYCRGADLTELAENRRYIWYQYEELKSIKRKALHISKEAQKYGLGSILTNTYGKATSSSSGPNSPHHDHHDHHDNDDETQQALNTWALNSHSRRGLERWINEEYAAKRSDIRKRTIQSVLRAQAKMKDTDVALQGGDPDYAVKVLSRLSQAFSVDSQHFARGMGIADQRAAALDATRGNGGSHELPHLTKEDPSETDTASLTHGSSLASTTTTTQREQQDWRTLMAAKLGKATSHPPPSTTTASGKVKKGRNIGLTAPSVSADFWNYY